MTTAAARVSGFVGHLRHNGVEVGISQAQLALHVLGNDELPSLAQARNTLRILLTSRRSEWQRFDELFEAYWQTRGRVRSRPARSQAATQHSRSTAKLWGERAAAAGSSTRQASSHAAGDGESDDDSSAAGTGRLQRAASAREAIRRADLREIADPDEMARADQLALRIARALRYRLARRYRMASRGRRIDLRRTIRASLATGGEPLTLLRRRRAERPVRIVVLLDVSGSMQPYVRYLLQFVRGLALGWSETDVYLFNTRLTRITDVLREKDAILAMSRLSLMAAGFGGGTRMSESLRTFNDQYARRSLNSRSVFVVISDGYDTGSAEDCAAQFIRLRRRVRRVLWLNPMLGRDRYEPITRTMAALLPHIDHFASAHSLDALAALESELGNL